VGLEGAGQITAPCRLGRAEVEQPQQRGRRGPVRGHRGRKRWWPRVTDGVSLASSSGPTVRAAGGATRGWTSCTSLPRSSAAAARRPRCRRIDGCRIPCSRDPKVSVPSTGWVFVPTPLPEGLGAGSATRTRISLPSPEGAGHVVRTRQASVTTFPPDPPPAVLPSKLVGASVGFLPGVRAAPCGLARDTMRPLHDTGQGLFRRPQGCPPTFSVLPRFTLDVHSSMHSPSTGRGVADRLGIREEAVSTRRPGCAAPRARRRDGRS
jgi:hypothetical protein